MIENEHRNYTQKEEKTAYTDQDIFEYIDFRNILNDLFEGFITFWLPMLITVSLAATGGFLYRKITYEPKYRSSATFFVDVNNTVEYESSNLAEKAMSQISVTFPYVINSQALQIIIMDEFGVDEMPGHLYATTMSDTNLITIQSIADTPEISYRLLQVVLDNYPRISKKIIGNSSMKMIGKSEVPDEPINKDWAKSFAIQCVIICLTIWVCLIFLYSVLKRTIRKEEDFQNMLNTGCLGSIPMVRFKKRSNTQKNRILINQRSVGYDFVESIRTLRTRIERDQKENKSKIYMVSSSLPGEGKSTITINLALSFAVAGKTVYLVDMDFRNSSVCRILGIDEHVKGFTDIITNNICLDEVCLSYESYSNFSIISSGKTEDNFGRLLNNSKVPEFFELLRSKADIIFIDTAPSGLLSEASAIAAYADAGIYIVCQDYAPLERIREGIDMIVETGLRISGCILNMTENGILRYGYGYGYGYGYDSKYKKYMK